MMKKSTISSRRSGRQLAPGRADLSRRIQEKAFELYQRRGGAHGDDQADWFEAERIVLQEHQPVITGRAPAGAARGNKRKARTSVSRRKTNRSAGV